MLFGRTTKVNNLLEGEIFTDANFAETRSKNA